MCCNIKFVLDSLSGKCDPSTANVKKSVIFNKNIVICQNIIPDPCASHQHNARKIYVRRRAITVPPLHVSVVNNIPYI